MTREEAIAVLKAFMENPLFSDVHKAAFNIAIHDIEAYQKWNLNELVLTPKDNEQEPVLDKIRAEIETKYGQCDICEYFEDYDYEENDISEYRPIGNIADILQIIDKYKAESEDV